MLISLTVQNYALISQLEINFRSGFSVLTGETGAGKSIILGALSLILGQRADTKSIKQNEDKCLIEGVFDISSYALQSFFEERDLEYDEKHCILRREIFSNGKSRAFINDSPVGLADLKDLGNLLIDIHSQHQNLLLGDDRFQMRVIDVLSGNPELFSNYRKAFTDYTSVKGRLEALKKETDQSRQEEDYLRFQYQQLEEAKLIAGEQQPLEEEIKTLSNMEEIKSNLFHLSQILSDEEKGLILTLKEALSISQSLTKIYPSAKEAAERIQTSYFDLKDLAQDIDKQKDTLEYDPMHLQTLNERLDLIFSLQQKHKVSSVEELIEIHHIIGQKINTIDTFDEQIHHLEKELDEIFDQLLNLGQQIRTLRQKTAQKLEEKLIEKVSPLGMPHMRFSCDWKDKANPDISGFDIVTYLFSANKNSPLLPVAQVASGGEISRLMLGIKSLIAGAISLPSIIFDEIDTGVSGEIADKMGNIMHELGDVMQVITITHLPQIASQGNAHYFVYKEDGGETTATHIRQLSQEERIREIARMLSGSDLSEAAVANAKELLGVKR